MVHYIPGRAQSNIKAGYIGRFLDFQALDQLIDAYNIEYADQLDSKLPSFHFVHGLALGYRYRWTLTAININYEFSLQNTSAQAILAEQSIRLKYRHHNIGFGILQYLSEGNSNGFNIGIMPSIRYNFFNLNADQNGQNKADVLRMTYPAYRLALQIDLPSAKNQGLSVQPFIEFGFGSQQKLDTLAQYLGIDQASTGLPTTFGLQIVLYNGYQN